MQSAILSVLGLSLLMAMPATDPGSNRPQQHAGITNAVSEKHSGAAYSGLLDPMRTGILGRSSSVSRASLRALLAKNTQRVKPKNLLCTTYPCPAGYFWYYFTDERCPNSPDTYNAYIEYWNEDESFAYDAYAGHATYYCDGYEPSTVGSASNFLDCVANSPWNCNDLGNTMTPHP